MRPRSASAARTTSLHALLLADVGGVAARRAARVGDLARDRFELLGFAADQRDARAERGELVRGAAADAAAGAGHDAGLAGEQAGAEDRSDTSHGMTKPFSRLAALYQANAL